MEGDTVLKAAAYAIAFLTASMAQPAAAKLMIFGGEGHDEYLGCLDCSEYSSESICNEFGRFGNEFSTAGMFNEFAGFGNEFSAKSPWNEYSTSTSVPVLVDEKGRFYGYFTINTSRSNAVDFAPVLAQLFKSTEGHLEKLRAAFCKALNG
jgi:hypothetical protein